MSEWRRYPEEGKSFGIALRHPDGGVPLERFYEGFARSYEAARVCTRIHFEIELRLLSGEIVPGIPIRYISHG